MKGCSVTKKIRSKLDELGYEPYPPLLEECFDGAVIAISTDDRIIYSYKKLLRILMKIRKYDETEAIDELDYSICNCAVATGIIILMDYPNIFKDY